PRGSPSARSRPVLDDGNRRARNATPARALRLPPLRLAAVPVGLFSADEAGSERLARATHGGEWLMDAWNFASIWEAVAENLPDAPAVAQGGRALSWADFDRRANALGRFLLDAGVQAHDKVALYLYNCPEYLETCFACFKTSLVPVNTNYRYADDELAYLW